MKMVLVQCSQVSHSSNLQQGLLGGDAGLCHVSCAHRPAAWLWVLIRTWRFPAGGQEGQAGAHSRAQGHGLMWALAPSPVAVAGRLGHGQNCVGCGSQTLSVWAQGRDLVGTLQEGSHGCWRCSRASATAYLPGCWLGSGAPPRLFTALSVLGCNSGSVGTFAR